jgi:hypothetical protein
MGSFGQAAMIDSTSPLLGALEASSSYLRTYGIDKVSDTISVIAGAIALIVMSGVLGLGLGQGLDVKEPPNVKSWAPFGIGHLFGLLWRQSATWRNYSM